MEQHYKKVCVVGLGYVGLPTAAVIASHGMQVLGVDINPEVVDTVNASQVHIVEPDLEAVVRVAVEDGKLSAALKPEAADVFVLTVSTPFTDGYQPDLTYVKAAAQAIAPVLKKDDLVILESTCPVGATELLTQWLSEIRSDLVFPVDDDSSQFDVAICYCPERILPGRVIKELVENDRVIGGVNHSCAEAAKSFYQTFVQGQCVLSDARTAELAKLTENAFRDVNIAFANELSLICDEVGVNVWDLIDLTNHHPRVNVLKPGPGVGGHCIAVDPWFIISASKQARLMRTAREVNNRKPQHVVDQVVAKLANDKTQIACFGLAYKPDIDDLRESPALTVVELLAQQVDNPIVVVEPHIDCLPKRLTKYRNVCLESGIESAIEQNEVLAVLVAHRQFVNLAGALTEREKMIDVCGIGKISNS